MVIFHSYEGMSHIFPRHGRMTDPQEDWPLVVLAAAEGICDLSEALRRAVERARVTEVLNGECLPQLRVTITNYQPTIRLLSDYYNYNHLPQL